MTVASPSEPIIRYVSHDRAEAWIAAGWAVRLSLDGKAVLMEWPGPGEPASHPPSRGDGLYSFLEEIRALRSFHTLCVVQAGLLLLRFRFGRSRARLDFGFTGMI